MKFKKLTRYHLARSRKREVYLSNLTDFSLHISKNLNLELKAQDLVLYFGSIFYPKHFKQQPNMKKKSDLINQYHDLFYAYSSKRFKAILKKSMFFSALFTSFSEHMKD